MRNRRFRSLSIALLASTLVWGSACARSDSNTTSSEATTTTAGATSNDPTALANGGFGDLENVCQDGDASGATANGVTDTEIHVGTVTDKGGPVAGLNEEMYDAAVAFTKWCNEHGGILGRQLVLDDLDAKLYDYEAAMKTACENDFAMVGGGAVFDEDPNNVRVGCDVGNIAGYVVSERGRTADLQVQPIPNPVSKISASRYLAAAREFPEGIKHYGIMASAIPSVKLVRDQMATVAEQNGYVLEYSADFAPQGETGWDNFANDIKKKGVKVLEFVGQPSDLVVLDKAFQTAGYYPDVILLSTNFYDSTYAEEAGDIAGNVYIQSLFTPYELAKDNKATQDYLDLMDQYNPGGKTALLGSQGLSAWLLFAKAATECGSELTTDCLLSKAEAEKDWTGGGMHSRQTPGNDEPSPCAVIVGLEKGKFFLNEEATQATDGDGIFNCDPKNVADV